MATIEHEQPSDGDASGDGVLADPFDKDVPTLLALVAESVKRQAKQAARATGAGN